MLLSLSGCATTEKVNEQARQKAAAEAAQDALEAAEEMVQIIAQRPPMPDYCRFKVQSDVRLEDRLDVAVDKLDRALTKANNRITYCARWADAVEANLADVKTP